MCVGKLIIIAASDNGLLPGRRQAIIWNNAGIFSIGPLEINLGEMFIEIIIFIEENTFEDACEILSISSWPQCVNDITMYEVKHTLYLLWWLWYMFLHDQGSVPLTVLPSQCKSMEFFHSHLDSNTLIVTKLYTWHNDCAVVPYAN